MTQANTASDAGVRLSARAFAPATVANVACGFDIFGFAVAAPGDEVVAHYRETAGVTIVRITGDNGRLPREAAANTAGAAALSLLQALGVKHGVNLEVHKRMPLGSGLGSSAASAVAAVVAVNALLGEPFERRDLLPFALDGEQVSCGSDASVHADNVAPALLGGFTLIRSYSPLDVISLPVPDHVWCTLAHPDLEIRTRDARDALPGAITLGQAVTQWGNVAGMVAGLFMSDDALIQRSLQDVVAEPARASLIPGFYDVKRAAINAGALGCSISGGCPTVFALASSQDIAEAAGKEMCEAFARAGVASQLYVSPINRTGAHILEASSSQSDPAHGSGWE